MAGITVEPAGGRAGAAIETGAPTGGAIIQADGAQAEGGVEAEAG
jgi:hypothetical protein